MFSRFFSFLFSTGVWTFLGLVVLCYLIWVLGASLSINQWYPLEDPDVRVYVIVAIFSIWLLRILWRKWREGRLNAQLLGQLRKPSKNRLEENLPEKETAELRLLTERFDEAIDLLKNIRFEGAQNPSSLALFSKPHLYQLPWYVFIGAPGSGKTTALVNSGLNFPLADKFGKVALKGVGGTRNCDWWFTDDAVLLDTAGRYTTHESDPVNDEEEWNGFLDLLVKYRGRQPINGVMMTISIADLLSSNDTDRAQHAAVLRRRLQDLREQLGIQFPVYVMVTKMDLLSGFEAYFNACSRQELEQVWGFTFSYEKSQEAGFKLLDAYNTEYERLKKRLFDAMPTILGNEPDEQARAKAYLLPQQFASLQSILGYFLSDVFSTARFESRVLPRGVYFTSGTQGGQTFDQVSDPLKKHLKIEGGQAPQSSLPTEAGKSYFLHKLLKDVVFRESGLAGLNLKWEKRYRTLQWTGYGVMATVTVVCLLAWLMSYRNNSGYLEHVNNKLPDFRQLSQDIKITRAGDVLGLMPFMNAAVDLPDGPGFKPDDAPLGYGFGLYQGYKIQAAAGSVYDDTLKQVLLPQISQKIEWALEQADPNDLERSYEALRAYLMLYDTARYDPVFLKTWVLGLMRNSLPVNYTRAEYDRLSNHVGNLLDQGVITSPFPKNEALVERVRSNLDRHSLPVRVYSRMQRLLANAELKPATLVSLGGAEATSVFVRASGKPLNEGIPGLYSYNGYWNIFSKRLDEVAMKLRQDDEWVLEIVAGREDDRRNKVIEDVKRLYFNDYVRQWDNYLADVTLRKPSSLIEGIELARSLSSSNSPLVKYLKAVAYETTLLREDERNQRSFIDKAKERVSSSTQSLEQMFGPVGLENAIRQDATPERLEEMVDRHFVKYRELATSIGQGEPAPIEGTVALLNELYTYLTAADAALRSQSPLPPADVLSKLQAESGRLPEEVGAMLSALSVQSASELNSLRQEKMGEDVNATLGNFCRRAIAGRYPFANSAKDVAPNDFARFFGPQQMLEQFFQQNLQHLVDVSGTRLRFKPGIDGSKGDVARYLGAFENGAVIRDVYFAAGRADPSFKVAIRPLEMDPEITQFIMDVDGQPVTYSHGPQIGTTVEWPGKRGSNQVSISLMPQTGTSGLSSTGPWALNRMLDRASIRRGKSPEVTIATFNIGGRSVTLEFTAYSAKSPFRLPEMRGFACPGKG